MTLERKRDDETQKLKNKVHRLKNLEEKFKGWKQEKEKKIL